MTTRIRRLLAAGAAAGAALALTPGAFEPLGALAGAGILTDLACISCGAAGVSALLSGGVTLAAVMWSQSVFLAASTCVAVCAAALTT